MKKLLLFSLVLLSSTLSAQTIVGKLTDSEGQPLSYVNVLLQTTDSAYVVGTVSDELGAFRLTNNGKGSILRFSSIGYNTIYREANLADMGTIILTADSLGLLIY